jgi:2-dehydropantoate 2-reductase
MRYIMYGAGAIGGTIGASLFESGQEVVLIARGEHGRAIAAKGLRFGSVLGGWRTLAVPVVEHPRDLSIGAGDVVVLAMKSQDTQAALEALALVASPDVHIVCAQNGVANERMALRHFPNVHGLCVRMPGVHLEPGVVQVHQGDCNGIADVGSYPRGASDVDRTIAADLEAGSIRSFALDDVMAQKYAKLALNVTNALEAAMGTTAPATDLSKRARQEALDVFAAAGISVATGPDPRTADRSRFAIDGVEHPGNSAFQSLARGVPRLEADYLNGEVVLLGRLHGVPTPANEFLQELAIRLVKERVPAGSLTIEEVEAMKERIVA